jgi:putative alpha-1,2-mannosidase
LKYAFFGSSFAEWLFFKFEKHYVEGDAWHFRFYGTDPLKTFGSAELFVRELDRFMTLGRIDPLTVRPNRYYWAGNEPGMDAPWQFASANRSDLTAEHVRWVARHRYTTKPDGIPGNDDYGALSGWLAWAHLGFYPLYSGKTQLSVSIPMFRNIRIAKESDGTLRITRHGAGSRIAKLTLDGQTIAGATVNVADFVVATNVDFYLH